MNEHADQLRETFEAHEYLAPDSAAVYAKVEELSRTYRRRRRSAQAAGGAVLGAGLVAGGISLPNLLPGGSQHVVVQAPAAAPAFASTPTTSPTTAPPETETQRDLDAYAAAGYGYDDAFRLAKIWHLKKPDIVAVKAEAGKRLLAGETLPIKPGPEKPDPGAAEAARGAADVEAFFAAGYTVKDAEQLALLWHTQDSYHAKIKGGKKLLAGQTLPIAP